MVYSGITLSKGNLNTFIVLHSPPVIFLIDNPSFFKICKFDRVCSHLNSSINFSFLVILIYFKCPKLQVLFNSANVSNREAYSTSFLKRFNALSKVLCILPLFFLKWLLIAYFLPSAYGFLILIRLIQKPLSKLAYLISGLLNTLFGNFILL